MIGAFDDQIGFALFLVGVFMLDLALFAFVACILGYVGAKLFDDYLDRRSARSRKGSGDRVAKG